MTEKIIKHIIRQKLAVIVVINKVDRLIVEMKIPPEDAYLKLKHTLEEVNGVFLKCAQQMGMENNYKISPVLGNVVFSAAEYGFIFSLELMARKYHEKFPGVDPNVFKNILWGDYYFNRETRRFQRKPQPPPQDRKRTFVQYVLDPIYKIFAHTVGKDRPDLEQFLAKNLEIALYPDEYLLNIKTLIKLIMKKYFGAPKCLIQSLVDNISAPTEGA